MTCVPLFPAYLGPGSALTLIGSAIALLAAVGFGFIGLIWYPLKRFLRMFRSRGRPEEVVAPAAEDVPQ